MAVKINIDASYFNKAYLPYLNREERYQIFYGGAGSGKSYFLASKLILDLLSKKQKLLVVRQVFASIKDSVYEEIVQAIYKLKVDNLVTISKSTFDITFVNGSKIIFKGADDERKLLSISGIDMVWVEEASDITKELFNQLELRLRGGSEKKKYFLSFNPISATHWLKTDFFDNPREDSFVCHTTYKDNIFLDDEYIASLEEMKERNPSKYQVYALGEWGTSSKQVFENWTVQDFDTSQIVQSNPNIKSAFGMDFGYVADPSTFIGSLVDLDNMKIYIFDEMYEHGLLNNQLADKIVKMGYGKERIIADSAEQKSIAELSKLGLKRISGAKKGRDSINHGIQFLLQFEIIVHSNCTNTINELTNYGYKKDKQTGQYTNQPIDNYNHLIDALRYSLEPLSMRRGKFKISKGLFGL
ncbi:PBSX family phage terminase large subunit [Enterococcus casseliflavus]|uniref:PBSX family phage terminase large subunit n=1 Tax=Enterococcus casseliflavus TaxID=37734 RepID=UPI002DB64AF8|nr:PBSX family phage terminase large subunit [Enterococcus casseliflavus]MEB6213517.1 PBSX family phage terminase large subunit [Enterococcus casseliflavus]